MEKTNDIYVPVLVLENKEKPCTDYLFYHVCKPLTGLFFGTRFEVDDTGTTAYGYWMQHFFNFRIKPEDEKPYENFDEAAKVFLNPESNYRGFNDYNKAVEAAIAITKHTRRRLRNRQLITHYGIATVNSCNTFNYEYVDTIKDGRL